MYITRMQEQNKFKKYKSLRVPSYYIYIYIYIYI